MRLLLDQGIARSTVVHLRDLNITSAHVGDLGLAAATDEEILDVGRNGGWVVVTLDADFHALLARSNASQPSVIRVRVEGLKGEAMASIICRVLESASIDLADGAAVTVTERRISMRRLPLKSR